MQYLLHVYILYSWSSLVITRILEVTYLTETSNAHS